MYDVIIIGGGPCGVTAGIYAKRSGLKTLLFEQSVVGGQVINTYEIKNFPTYPNISGADFCYKLYEQALENDIEIMDEEVISIDLKSNPKIVKTKKNTYESKTIILSTGSVPNTLNIENEEKFIGRGISFCALCDGNLFKDKNVAVVGGGDNAVEDIIYLSSICKKVYVVVRKDKLKAQDILQKSLERHIKENGNIEIYYNANVEKIYGDNKIEKIDINQNDDKISLDIDGLFLAIGKKPNNQLYKDQIKLNDYGYILVDNKMMTSIKGVFAGGDCIEKSVRQIITACSEGALCATFANQLIKEN